MDSGAGRKKKRRAWGIVLVLILALLVLASGTVLKSLPDRSSPGYRVSTDRVVVREVEGDLYFLPVEAKSGEPGLAIYPGARVPPGAYSYLARAVAESGRPAAILKAPFGFAILGTGALERAMKEVPDTGRWVLAGHSLGGVAAALYASRNPEIVAALVFLASYPSGGSNLAATGLPVLSIRATNDHLATAEKIEKAKPLLPPDTIYRVIEGGNHAQFGDYGPQDGDGAAEITTGRQQVQVIDAVLALFASLASPAY
ncbi:MAG: alpha/beta hydrolase [Rectinemataceae bacterium]